MAIAATPITASKGFADLLRPPERAVALYRRLLAMNKLFCSMNSAQAADSLYALLGRYFQKYLPESTVRLWMAEGGRRRKVPIFGAQAASGTEDGLVAGVLKSALPVWIPDGSASRKVRKFAPGRAETQSVLVLPLMAEGKAVGCLEMASRRPGRFDEVEYHLGMLLSANVAACLDSLLSRQELARARDSLCEMNERLKQMAHTDESTGLYNKRRLLEQLEIEIARSRRYRDPFSCLMLDLDDFKTVNDTHGHQAGDEVLRQVGVLLTHSLRRSDFIARYGGEEFTVILPKTDSPGAQCAAENLRARFSTHPFAVPGAFLRLTVSIGVACFADVDRLDAQTILSQADRALYRAKRAGKNQTCLAAEPDAPESEYCQVCSGA